MAGAKRGPDFADRRLVHCYAAAAAAGPSKLLLRALEYAGGSSAADLGCGVGRDTLLLSRRGYSVLAIDHAPGAMAALRLMRLPGVTARFADFRRARLRAESFDLVHACLSLPFAGPEGLPPLVRRIERSLRPGGVFSFHLFGPRDEFNQPGCGIAFHTRAEVEELVGGLELLELEERRPRGRGSHLFQVVARVTGEGRRRRPGRGSSPTVG